MPSVKLMTWNIQNFGQLKTSMDDLVLNIGRVVADNNIDILAILELDTNDYNNAAYTLDCVLKACNKRAGGNYYKTGVLSYLAGDEFYGFVVRDINQIRPVTVSGPAKINGKQFVTGAEGVIGIEDAEFTTRTTNNIYTNAFPLMTPDMPLQQRYSLRQNIPQWPANNRYPCLGLFEIVGANVNCKYLPITVIHTRPASAEDQVNAMAYMKVIGDFGNTQLNINANKYRLPFSIVTGDFNIDITKKPSSYRSFMQGGFTNALAGGTFLLPIYSYVARDYKLIDDLIIEGYDNFFWSEKTGGTATISNSEVIKIPQYIKDNKLKFDKSIDHYSELDKRGFSSESYKLVCNDFENQLRGISQLYMTGILLGSRLISDHLPVVTTINIP